MPLREGKSRDVLKYNVGEMMRSPTFGAGKNKKKKQEMSIAAAYSSARKSGGKFPRKRKRK